MATLTGSPARDLRKKKRQLQYPEPRLVGGRPRLTGGRPAEEEAAPEPVVEQEPTQRAPQAQPETGQSFFKWMKTAAPWEIYRYGKTKWGKWAGEFYGSDPRKMTEADRNRFQQEFVRGVGDFGKTATRDQLKAWRYVLGVPAGLEAYEGGGRAAVMGEIEAGFLKRMEGMSPEERAGFVKGAPKELRKAALKEYSPGPPGTSKESSKSGSGPTIPDIDIPQELLLKLKPDKPGGQTHTFPNGKVIYLPGKTMYEMGFRTPEEYRDAQRYGLTYGPHSGEKVPDHSILIEHRLIDPKTRKYKTIRLRYSNKPGVMAPSLRAHVKKLDYKVEVETYRGTRLVDIKDIQAFNKLKGKAQFKKAMEMGLIPKGSEYVGPITKEDIARIERQVKETKMTGAPPVKLSKLTPRDWVYLTAKQVKDREKYLEEAETRAKETVEIGRERRETQKVLERDYIKLGTGEWVDKASYNGLPKYQQGLLDELGVDEFNKRYDRALASLSSFRATGDDGEIGYDIARALWSSLSKKDQKALAQGKTSVWQVLSQDIQDRITLVFGQGVLDKARQQLFRKTWNIQIDPTAPTLTWGDLKKEPAFEAVEKPASKKVTIGPLSMETEAALARGELQKVKPKNDLEKAKIMAAQIGLSLIPGVVPYWKFKEYQKDGFTTREIAEIVGWSLLDLLTILPVIGGVAAGARAARGLTTAARLKAIARGAKQVAIAEIKAPYTMIRHPIRTLRTLAEPIETIFRGSKVPLAATEIRASTVRIPIRMLGTETTAKKLRDIATLRAIRGKKALAKVGDVSLELTQTALQKLSKPCGVHSAPDVRFFLEGAVITRGREGGLFISPSVHSRFTYASAFGDMPEGMIRGALLIRDERILRQLSPTGKVFRGSTEIEAMLKAGVKLDPPTQVLMTRDAAGEKLTLLVFGEKFSAGEIARLKFMGSVDTVKQLFVNPAKVNKTSAALSGAYDELLDLRKQITKLRNEAKRLKARGKLTEATKLEAQARLFQERAARIAERFSNRVTGRLALLASNTQYRAPLERMERVLGSRLLASKVRRLPAMDIDRGTLGTIERQMVRRPMDTQLRRALMAAPEIRALYKGKEAPARTAALYVAGGAPEKVMPLRAESKAPAKPVPARAAKEPPLKPLPPKPSKLREEKPRRRPPRQEPDKEKRKRVRAARGAVAFRMGELHDKDVWHVLVEPYGKGDHITVLGRKPRGATITRGPRSAYKTAQSLTGKTFSDDVLLDLGIMDVKMESISGKKVRISFEPDPDLTRSGSAGISKNEKVFPLPRG